MTDRLAAFAADPAKAGFTTGKPVADAEHYTGVVPGIGDVDLYRLKAKKTDYYMAVTGWKGDTAAIVARGKGKPQTPRAMQDVWLLQEGPFAGMSAVVLKIPGEGPALWLTTPGFAKVRSQAFP